MKYILIYLLYILSFWPLNLDAQSSLKFQSISSSNGLSNSNAGNILQDNKGFIWIGTYDGLNRYDGYEFKIYRNEEGNPNSLSHSHINSTFYDSKGRLWVGTPFGASLFNALEDNFVTFAPVDHLDPKNRSVYWFYEDADNKIWVGTNSGINYFDENLRELKYHVLSEEISGQITVFLQDQENNYWIGTKHGLFQYQKFSKEVIHFKNLPGNPHSLSENTIAALLEDSQGNLWVGTEGGLNLLNKSSQSFTHFKNRQDDPFSLSHDVIRCLSEGKPGTLWIGTKEGGANLLDITTGKFTRFLRNSKDKYSIADNTVKDIFIDKMGGVWIASFRGVSFSDHYQNQFVNIAQKEYDPQSLTDDYTTALFKDSKNQIWVGNRNGISLFHPQKESFTHFLHNPEDSVSIGDGAILSITEDKEGNLWTASHLGLINKFNRESKRFERLKPSGDEYGPKPRSNFTYADKNGIVWITYMNGISEYDPQTKTFTHYDLPDSHNGSHASYIFEDSQQNLLIVDWGAIILFDRKKKQFSLFKNIPRQFHPFRAIHIHEDQNQDFWIGTAYHGMFQINIQKGFFKAYSKNLDLPDIYCRGILEDRNEILWISSNKGIVRFNKKTSTYKIFNKNDGILNSEYNSKVCVLAEDGKLYFGGNNGITAFHPEKILENPHPPKVAITKFELFNKEVPISPESPLKTSIIEAKQINLNHKQNVLSFEFVGLNFNAPEKNQYAYKMEGFDADWHYSGTRRHATYTNLPPGKTYTFRVKASNNDGIWNEEGTSVDIYINPPFWLTWWFYAIVSAVFILSLYALHKWRTRQHILKRRILERMVKERTEEVEAQKEAIYAHAENLEKANYQIKKKNKKIRHQAKKLKMTDQLKSEFLANISHEFRTPLTLILIPLEELIKSSDANHGAQAQLSVMKRNAKRLLQLINQLLDLSKLEDGSIPVKASQNDIISFLKTIKHSFDSLAKKHDIDYQFISCEESILTEFDPDLVEKIVSNLLANAFKFTKEKDSITLAVNYAEEAVITGQNLKKNPHGYLKIEVKDTGVGIPKEHLPYVFDRFYQADNSLKRKSNGTGIGLALAKELVALQGGSIRVESQQDKGTLFTVFHPLIKGGNTDKFNQQDTSQIAETVNDPGLEELIFTENANIKESAPVLLIVEDNDDMRQQIRRIFCQQFRIEEAADGVEGLKAANEKLPDLIISDVMMPGQDGFTFCNQLKSDIATSHIPTILLSARIDGIEKGLQIGADDYITKPFNARQLELKVKNLLTTRQKFREAICREIGRTPISETGKENNLHNFDQEFISHATEIALAHLTDTEFDMEVFYKALGMSRTLVYNKLKSLTGLGPNEFIRQIRLNKASQLLAEEKLTVAEAMSKAGFNHRSYFVKCFKNQFGHLPSEHAACKITYKSG